MCVCVCVYATSSALPAHEVQVHNLPRRPHMPRRPQAANQAASGPQAAWRASVPAPAPSPGGASRMLLVLSVRAGGKPGNRAGTRDSIMRRPSSMPVRMVPASVHSGE